MNYHFLPTEIITSQQSYHYPPTYAGRPEGRINRNDNLVFIIIIIIFFCSLIYVHLRDNHHPLPLPTAMPFMSGHFEEKFREDSYDNQGIAQNLVYGFI